MKPFSFAAREFAQDLSERGYVHIRDGVTAQFLQFANEQLSRCRKAAHNELLAREIKSKKRQYLFDLPDHVAFLDELLGDLAVLTGCHPSALTLSERHIMIYDENAVSLPPLHKDRLASEFSVGIPLEPSGCGRIALSPGCTGEINLLDNAVYDNAEYLHRPPAMSPRAIDRWNSDDGKRSSPRRLDGTALIELEAKPGDVVVFRGSSIYHGRIHSAKSSILYFKLNTMRLDPLGEDPSTEIQRTNTVELLSRKDDEELLNSVVELSPRLQHVNRQYSRLHWKSLLRVNVSGEEEFTISDEDLSFLFALRGRQRVRDILVGSGVDCEDLLSHAPRLRRLGMLGGINFLT